MSDIYNINRKVYIDGKELLPDESQKIVNHSPDGFSWGYAGSGPSQLALALLLHFTDQDFAKKHYQQFKADIVAGLPEDFRFNSKLVANWIKTHKGEE